VFAWLGDFFGALPDAFVRLYQFGDPSGKGNGWWGFVIAGIWAVGLTAIPLFIARRTYGTHEWVSASMGVLGATAIFFWIYGVIPSGWVYFVDSNKDVLEHAIIPSSFVPNIGTRELKIATNLYVVIRDTVVVIEHLIALGATFWAALAIQKRFPRTYAPGEEKRESGGYH
jgi:hypothetical protein